MKTINKKRKSARKKREYTLVRGPDGTLYLVNEKDPPVKLKKNQEEEVADLLDKFEDTLSEILKREIILSGPGVHLATPAIFPE
ncbi:MAG: hypothetical protein ACREIF_17265 [Chthoniobacterales bacterium]